ncbi:MAG TPA: HAMP domain-containing sensor histidine kinase, partial [Longimicrobium sp.]|nr:HAMP domain-containing sensor histidine kinase [Longimicrobium sp.]
RPVRARVPELPEDAPARALLGGLGVEHYAMVPMRSGEEAVGALGVVRGPGAPPFDEPALRLLSILGDQAALAVRNARLYEASQAASRAKTDFLAMMSHELRTPLNALEGYASLLEEGIYGPVNEQQGRALSRMRVARRHLMALIDQVLDLARVEARRKEAEIAETDVGDLLRGVGEALRGAAEAKGLALEVDPGGVGRARTDPGLLRQVVTNLLGNAFKFTEEGRVSLRARREAGRIVVEVADTGPGIAPEHHARIFEPFYQVDPSITRKEGGSGLGLALSREFARLLGGDLALRSAPGEGATFVLTLPG